MQKILAAFTYIVLFIFLSFVAGELFEMFFHPIGIVLIAFSIVWGILCSDFLIKRFKKLYD